LPLSVGNKDQQVLSSFFKLAKAKKVKDAETFPFISFLKKASPEKDFDLGFYGPNWFEKAHFEVALKSDYLQA